VTNCLRPAFALNFQTALNELFAARIIGIGEGFIKGSLGEGKNMKRLFSFTIVALLVTVTLSACGNSTNTTSPGNSGAAAGATQGGMGSMPGMTMQPGQSMAPSTAASTTMASSTTTMAATTMAGMNMTPGTTMAGMTTMPGTTAASGTMVSATPGNDAMTQSLKNLSGAEFETKFMQEMIAHHSSAIDMAKLVSTNTKRPELIKLSQDIISAQDKEITEMTGWLASWYSAKPLADNMSAPGMMDMMGQMDQLKNAKDAAFDKLFLSMMIEHHSNAVSMASLVPQKTQRPELLKLSQDIIKSQSAEIQEMQTWQKTWFPT